MASSPPLWHSTWNKNGWSLSFGESTIRSRLVKIKRSSRLVVRTTVISLRESHLGTDISRESKIESLCDMADVKSV